MHGSNRNEKRKDRADQSVDISHAGSTPDRAIKGRIERIDPRRVAIRGGNRKDFQGKVAWIGTPPRLYGPGLAYFCA